MSKTGAIILAAGKGTRLNCKDRNKVMLLAGGKPLLSYTIKRFEQVKISPIIVVVGFAYEQIMDYFGDRVVYAIQKEQKGTAHAARVGLAKLPKNIQHVLVVNGDDSYLYSKALLNKLISTHVNHNADLTILTITIDNPTGLGRILRDTDGNVLGSVEEKDATNAQRKIKEVNPQCWVFRADFLKKYLPKIQRSDVTGEYYLNAILELAVLDKKRIVDVPAGNIPWRGVNHPEELEEANRLVER